MQQFRSFRALSFALLDARKKIECVEVLDGFRLQPILARENLLKARDGFIATTIGVERTRKWHDRARGVIASSATHINCPSIVRCSFRVRTLCLTNRCDAEIHFAAIRIVDFKRLKQQLTTPEREVVPSSHVVAFRSIPQTCDVTSIGCLTTFRSHGELSEHVTSALEKSIDHHAIFRRQFAEIRITATACREQSIRFLTRSRSEHNERVCDRTPLSTQINRDLRELNGLDPTLVCDGISRIFNEHRLHRCDCVGRQLFAKRCIAQHSKIDLRIGEMTKI